MIYFILSLLKKLEGIFFFYNKLIQSFNNLWTWLTLIFSKLSSCIYKKYQFSDPDLKSWYYNNSKVKIIVDLKSNPMSSKLYLFEWMACMLELVSAYFVRLESSNCPRHTLIIEVAFKYLNKIEIPYGQRKSKA